MSVATHLNIRLDEYDSLIGTFIPGYDRMVDAAARCLLALDPPAATVVDLGTGTGALAARCARMAPAASFVAIDEDAEMLGLARERLAASGTNASFVQSSFLDIQLPRCDAAVASLALHHVRTADRKQQLYHDIRRSLRDGGLLVIADCCPSTDSRLAAVEHDAWRSHMRATYSESEVDGYFAGWAEEDVYLPLEQELDMLRGAGFRPEVVWRLAPMAVIAARAQPTTNGA